MRTQHPSSHQPAIRGHELRCSHPLRLNRRSFCLLGLGALSQQPVLAMWAKLSDEDLIHRSALIVLGEWVGESSLSTNQGGPEIRVGAIAVQQVLRDSTSSPSTRSLALLNLGPAGVPLASDSLTFLRGNRGLWLLRVDTHDPRGLFRCDHPQRFVSSDKDPSTLDRLRRLLNSDTFRR